MAGCKVKYNFSWRSTIEDELKRPGAEMPWQEARDTLVRIGCLAARHNGFSHVEIGLTRVFNHGPQYEVELNCKEGERKWGFSTTSPTMKGLIRATKDYCHVTDYVEA